MRLKRKNERKKGAKTERKKPVIYTCHHISVQFKNSDGTTTHTASPVHPNLTKQVLHKLLGFHTTTITNSSRLQKLLGHRTTKTKTSRISYTVRIGKSQVLRVFGWLKVCSPEVPQEQYNIHSQPVPLPVKQPADLHSNHVTCVA